MSVQAGSIIHLQGDNVIDRIQSAGLGDVRLPVETIREVGNREVVDQVPGEPDFTFTIESLDVGTDLMAWMTGKRSAGTASASAPGASDPDGTGYNWLDCQFLNIPSPWKDPVTGSAGVVEAGHLIPAYYPTRYTQRFGVTDNATMSVEMAGGSFYYGKFAPREDYFDGDGGTTDFVTDENTIHHRLGGAEGTTYRDVFGVIVDGVLQVEDTDYTVSGGDGSPATISFVTAPANNADIRCCYFTDAATSFPQAVHASSLVKPGAVRGRNIRIEIDGSRIGNGQSFEMEATIEGEIERELGNDEIIGRTVNGSNCTGTFTIRAKDADAFFNIMQAVTGVAQDEIYGWFNNNTVVLDVKIENPKNPGTYIKTIRIDDAKFQPPGTPARVNSPTDFAIQFQSVDGTFTEYKGEPA